jgi:hypothetical protein
MLHNPVPPRHSTVAPRLQRRCAHGNKAGEECAKCASVQRKARDGAPGRRQAPEVEAVLANPGRPLPPPVRHDMEARFGEDFGAVRIHDDAAGARAADAVDAEAFAYGNDIAFAAGRFNPETPAGRELLAHELAHTVQQSRGAEAIQPAGAPPDGALEREADAAAAAALAFAPLPSLSATPAAVARATPAATGSKAKTAAATKKRTPIQIGDKTYEVVVTKAPKTYAGVTEEVAEVEITPFFLPLLKGDRALKMMQDSPPSPVIRVPSGGKGAAALKQVREETDKLRGHWLRHVGWTAADANTLWKACGGDEFPKVKKGDKIVTCQMDHIVELQIAGGGNPANIQALNANPNRDSGQFIRKEIGDLASAIANDPALGLNGLARDLVLRMRFTETKPCEPGPDAEDKACIEVDEKARLTKGSFKLMAGRMELPLMLRAGAEAFSVDEKTKAAPIEDDTDNKGLRLAYPGLILTELESPKAGKHPINAKIDFETSRLPLKATKSKEHLVLHATATDEPKLVKKPAKLPIELLLMSPGYITKFDDQGGKLAWTGEINPTHKFLPKLTIDYADEKLWISSGLDKAKLEAMSPIPGAKVTDASIKIDLFPEFKPSGNLAFELSAKTRKLMAATVEIYPEDNALAAKGTVKLAIPRVDEAGGTVKYSKGAWSMDARIAADKINVPFLESGELTATYAKQAFSAQGTLKLRLPGGGAGTMTLGYDNGRWLFTGEGTLSHGDFADIKVSLRDDGETFTATGNATIGIAKLGLTPQIAVTFKQKKGEDQVKVSGSGSVLFNRKNLTGKLGVTLHESGKITGEGRLTFPVRDDLLVEVDVEMDEKQEVTTTGTAKLTKPIDLFPAKSGDYKLTLLDLAIPIPGLSAGPIGLKFGIACGIDAGYYFGPAQLKDVEVGGKLKPFKPDPDLTLSLKGMLSIDAGADLGFWIKGSLIADLGLGKATGSITVAAGAQATGNASLITTVNYAKGVFDIVALAQASAKLDLYFSVTASVELTTIFGKHGPGARWDWTLAKFLVPTGLSFSFSAPVSYNSVKGFTLPSAKDILWKPPQSIDAGKLLKNFLEAARKSGPPE